MKQSNRRRGVIFSSVIALAIGGRAWGAAPPQTIPAPTDSTLSIARFYTAPIVNVGEFPGRLVQVPCDADASDNPTARREQPQHAYALIAQDSDVIHPLLPGTDEARRELNSIGLNGRNVAVQGKYYPSTGAIFVSRVVARESGTVRPGEASEPQTAAWPTVKLSLAQCASD